MGMLSITFTEFGVNDIYNMVYVVYMEHSSF